MRISKATRLAHPNRASTASSIQAYLLSIAIIVPIVTSFHLAFQSLHSPRLIPSSSRGLSPLISGSSQLSIFPVPATRLNLNGNVRSDGSQDSTNNKEDTKNARDGSVAVKATDLDDAMDLSQEERTVVNVHRTCSPSVVYVTSVLAPLASTPDSNDRGDDTSGNSSGGQRLPPQGMSLGSGSGFVVDSDADGYIVTNYHVIQRAFEANQARMRYEQFVDGIANNATRRIQKFLSPSGLPQQSVETLVNQTMALITGRKHNATLNAIEDGASGRSLPAQVFVRFGADESTSLNSDASYRQCDIVDVVKELDIAVLRLRDNSSQSTMPTLRPLVFGSSSNLLVGQSLLAIGNPFGLDRTITSGLVSALGRSVTGVAGNPIRNCIQTDAAINPGNSGGPLLDLRGRVVGVNTMIISTSGSSAGIGFAVPGDKVKEVAMRIVDLDKEKQRRSYSNPNDKRKGRGWLGVEVATGSLEQSLRKRLPRFDNNKEGAGAFLTDIVAESPAQQQISLHAAQITDGSVALGDRIVDIGGKYVWNGIDFESDIKRRVEGEQLPLTVEDTRGERRVVYVTLGRIPL